MSELPFRKRVYYGMGGLSMNLPDLLVMQWILVRYVPPDADKQLIPAALMGVVLFLARMVEGFSNPFIAHWSDSCTSRWGRRLPFVRLGIVPLAAFFFLSFMPPVDHLHWVNSVHAFVALPLYSLFYGVVVTPYLSLLPEITSELEERVDLATSQAVFLMLTTVLGFSVMPTVLEAYGWGVFAGSAAVAIVLFMLPVATRIREKPGAVRPHLERLGLWQSIVLALKNRPFRYLMLSTSFYWFALNGLVALVTYWVLVVLERGEGSVGILMAPFIAVNIVFFFVFNALSRRFSKYALLLATFAVSGFVMAALALVGHLPFGDKMTQTAVVLSLFGVPAAGFMVLPFAMLADIADYDEEVTGRRREGIFFGVQGVFQKVMIGLSLVALTTVPYLRSDGAKILRAGESIRFSGAYAAAGSVAGKGTHAPGGAVEDVIEVLVEPAALDAPWTLEGPGGFVRAGRGSATIAETPPGAYRIVWGDVPGYIRPLVPATPTVFGLKAMALLCGLACFAACLLFIKYPLRERGGKAVLIAEG